MSLPALILTRDKRSVTRDDMKMVKTRDFFPADTIIFELRPPFMGNEALDEQNMVDVATEFLKLSSDVSGFIGYDKQKSGILGVMTPGNDPFEQNRDIRIISTLLVGKMSKMCYQLKEIAKMGGLVPPGKDILQHLIRFDTQFRPVKMAPANNNPVNTATNRHVDNMSAEPSTFAPSVNPYIQEMFHTPENKTRDGIAVLIYLRAEQTWSGTELCISSGSTGDHVLTFKPTEGDVVVMNETTVHGVCNAENLAGATTEDQARIILRVSMPYDV